MSSARSLTRSRYRSANHRPKEVPICSERRSTRSGRRRYTAAMPGRSYAVGSSDSVAAPSSNRYPEHLVNASSSELTTMELGAEARGGGTSRRRGRGGLPRRAGAGTARGWRRSIWTSGDAEDRGGFELGTEILGGAGASGEDETGETDGIGAKWSSSVCNGMIFCGSAFSDANSTSERVARIFWSACRTQRKARRGRRR